MAGPNEVPVIGEDDDLISKLEKWDTLLDSHWGEWTDEAKENFKFVSGDQWAEEDIAKMREMKRTYITFNYTEKFIDAVAGSEINNRQEVKYLPRQIGDSGVNEILTGGAQWVRDECDAEHEESEQFRDNLICGVGVTNTRPDYDLRQDVQIVIERRDPTRFKADPASEKANFADMRYCRYDHSMSREEFEERWPEFSPDGTDPAGKRVTIVDPEQRYHNGILSDGNEDEVVVCEYQWFEMFDGYKVTDPSTGKPIRVPPHQYEPLEAQYQQATGGASYGGQRIKERVYYRAFKGQGRILPHPETGEEVQELPEKDFTYKAQTGKRDREKGTWYGIVRAMKDPQRYGNIFTSMINHYLKTNAKGGVIYEEGAVSDIREFEESWSASDATLKVTTGALSGGKIQPRPPVPWPTGLAEMAENSLNAIPSVTGINLELLGMADREQAGVLEQQRKQAAYGILAQFFDSQKRYRKEQGRLLLKMMQLYIPQGTLVRITGQDGKAQYVPFAYDPGVLEFDVIVDDAPSGPNQKQQNFTLLLSLIQVVGPQNVPAEIWPEVVRNSPLSVSLVDKITDALQQRAQAPPSPEQQIQLQHGQAQVADLTAAAQKKQADAAKTQVETSLLQPQAVHESIMDEADQAHETSRQINDRIKALAALIPQQSSPAPTEGY